MSVLGFALLLLSLLSLGPTRGPQAVGSQIEQPKILPVALQLTGRIVEEHHGIGPGRYALVISQEQGPGQSIQRTVWPTLSAEGAFQVELPPIAWDTGRPLAVIAAPVEGRNLEYRPGLARASAVAARRAQARGTPQAQENGLFLLELGELVLLDAPKIASLTLLGELGTSASVYLTSAALYSAESEALGLSSDLIAVGCVSDFYSWESAAIWVLSARTAAGLVVPPAKFPRGVDIAAQLVRLADLTCLIDIDKYPGAAQVGLFDAAVYEPPTYAADQVGRAFFARRRLEGSYRTSFNPEGSAVLYGVPPGACVLELWREADFETGYPSSILFHTVTEHAEVQMP